MSMIISQDYMETYVINPMAKRIADLETKIDEILRYQKNFDSEIFCSLSRQEEKIDAIWNKLNNDSIRRPNEPRVCEEPKPKIIKKVK